MADREAIHQLSSNQKINLILRQQQDIHSLRSSLLRCIEVMECNDPGQSCLKVAKTTISQTEIKYG